MVIAMGTRFRSERIRYRPHLTLTMGTQSQISRTPASCLKFVLRKKTEVSRLFGQVRCLIRW